MKNRFTPLYRALLAAALVTAAGFSARAQGVGVGTTAPNASAALDVVSSAKGALLPRLTSAQRAAIASPATGLIVFQTDGTPGFYYNSGTPAAPVWQQIATASGAAITASNGLTKTGNNVALGGPLTAATDVPLDGRNLTFSGTGNVGIGTTTPRSTLQVTGSIAVGVVFGLVGSGSGTPLGNVGYAGLSPANAADSYTVPDAQSCPGRVYYVRNNSPSNSAYLGILGAGLFYEGGATTGSALYIMDPTGLTKTVIIISDGENWTVIKSGN